MLEHDRWIAHSSKAPFFFHFGTNNRRTPKKKNAKKRKNEMKWGSEPK
jgi:hypothetical protein